MEINRDSPSSGERKGISLNRREAIPSGVVGLRRGTRTGSRRRCESSAREGDSPVRKTPKSPRSIPSTAGHEKPRGNLGGPSAKAKYYLANDSEPVPWGKGEKNPGEGSET